MAKPLTISALATGFSPMISIVMAHSDRPPRPNEATVRPIVRPERNATVSALCTPSVAACAVRELARVAMYMPM